MCIRKLAPVSHVHGRFNRSEIRISFYFDMSNITFAVCSSIYYFTFLHTIFPIWASEYTRSLKIRAA